VTQRWQIVIFLVRGKANHAGLSIPGYGLADLSLRGARVVPWDAPSLPKGDPIYFDVALGDPARALEHLKQPGLLNAEIIRQEKARKGWHLTDDAPEFIRTLRSTRSCNPDDMNCVEWIVHALELGGLEVPDDVLTPADLLRWCEREIPRARDAMAGAAPAPNDGIERNA
jgi:hypothetical protein